MNCNPMVFQREVYAEWWENSQFSTLMKCCSVGAGLPACKQLVNEACQPLPALSYIILGI